MTLLALQRDFCSALSGRTSGIPRRLVDEGEAGLKVYKNAYRLRLRDCLRETFEKTWAWLGDAAFDAAVDRYIDSHESRSWTLDDYGDRFADALASGLPNAPEAAELAWLEWAMRRAFDGADAPATRKTEADLADWESAKFKFAPTLQLRSVTTNCAAIWAALAEEKTPPGVEFLYSPAALCVWRKELSPSFRTVDGVEFLALRLAIANVPFGEVCRLVADGRSREGAIALLGKMVGRWLQDGLLAAISPEPDSAFAGS